MKPRLFDAYFEFVKNTEPPMIYHRWSLLTAVGALLGRQFTLPFGSQNLAPTMYVMLIGSPGTRKSTAIKLSKRALSLTGYERFAATRTSKEKFMLDLEGIEDDAGKVLDTNKVMANFFGEEFVGGDPREVFIVADEFNEFCGHGNMEFISLLGNLWDWDEPIPFEQRLKNSRSVKIWQPTVSLLGGNTHAGFSLAFPPQAMGQGFLSRLLLVYGEHSGRKIAFPPPPSEEAQMEVVSALQEIKATVMGSATISKRAQGMLETIYRNYEGIDDVRFANYSTRRQTHLFRLCLIIAAINLRTEIGAEDVLFANTLLTFTEHRMPQAMGEFGKSKNADVAARVMAVFAEADQPLDVSDVWKHVQADMERVEDLSRMINGMLTANKIQFVPKTGSAQAGYMIVKKKLQNALYVDYSLLPETKMKG